MTSLESFGSRATRDGAGTPYPISEQRIYRAMDQLS